MKEKNASGSSGVDLATTLESSPIKASTPTLLVAVEMDALAPIATSLESSIRESFIVHMDAISNLSHMIYLLIRR